MSLSSLTGLRKVHLTARRAGPSGSRPFQANQEARASGARSSRRVLKPELGRLGSLQCQVRAVSGGRHVSPTRGRPSTWDPGAGRSPVPTLRAMSLTPSFSWQPGTPDAGHPTPVEPPRIVASGCARECLCLSFPNARPGPPDSCFPTRAPCRATPLPRAHLARVLSERAS
jgi:hypothetical protein